MPEIIRIFGREYFSKKSFQALWPTKGRKSNQL
jgi:hypothetical protein